MKTPQAKRPNFLSKRWPAAVAALTFAVCGLNAAKADEKNPTLDDLILDATHGDPNAYAVAKAVNQILDSNSRGADRLFNRLQPDFVATFDRHMSVLPELFDRFAPSEFASIFNLGVSQEVVQASILERRMAAIRDGSVDSNFAFGGSLALDSGLAGVSGPEGKSGKSVVPPVQTPWGFFITGLGEFTNVNDSAGVRGYNLTTGGFTAGLDYRVTQNFAVGLTAGYSHSTADLRNGGSLDVDGGKFGIYATAFANGFYLDTGLTAGWNSYDTGRGSHSAATTGSTDGDELSSFVTAGYDWKSGALTIGPVATFQYTHVSFNGFSEQGALRALTFSDQHVDSERTELGMKATYDWNIGGLKVKPEVRTSWQHEYGDTDYAVISKFANFGGPNFTVHGPAIGRDSLIISAGVSVEVTKNASAYVYYDGDVARTNYVSNNVSGGFRLSF